MQIYSNKGRNENVRFLLNIFAKTLDEAGKMSELNLGEKFEKRF
jgi:hypothetical protein